MGKRAFGMGASSIINARVRIGTYDENRDVMDEIAKRSYVKKNDQDEIVCRYSLARIIIDSENFGAFD